MRAKEFLNLYKYLEELLTARYNDSKKHFSSPIVQFANEDDGKRWREELNLCRDIRNLLSHHSDVEGESVVEPAESVLDTLRDIIDYIEHPILAADIMKPFPAIYTTTPDADVRSLIVDMDRLGYSHVPIVENKRLTGVFSASTVFSYIRGEQSGELEATRVCDFAEYTPVERHSTEAFRFMQKTVNLRVISDAFALRAPKSKRLAAIFITESGAKSEPLAGMITPWDVINATNKQNVKSEKSYNRSK